MKNQNPRIEFYRLRNFSEKLNVTFAFIRENWKPLLKYTFYIIMPICLVQAYTMNSSMSLYINALSNSASPNSFAGSISGFLVNYGITIICTFLGSAIMSGLIYSMMQTYATRENRLVDVTFNDFKGFLPRNIIKNIRFLLLYFLIIVLISAFVVLMAYLSTFTLVLTLPFAFILLILTIPLFLLIPIYVFERDIKLTDAIRKTWDFAKATFWGLLGLLIVLYFISSVLQTIAMVPWYIVTMVGSILSISSESMITQSVFYKFALYILGLIQSFGSYVALIIGLIGLAFQYFHAREKVEGVTIESNISNFDQL
jgi:hypothetical protein